MNLYKWMQEIYGNPYDFKPYEAYCANTWRGLNHDNRLATLVEKGIATLEMVENILIMDNRVDLLGTSIILPSTKMRQVCWFTKYEYTKILDKFYGQQTISNSGRMEECNLP